MQTYTSCITPARATQVEEVRKNYQKELADLKTKYDQELKRIGGNKSEANKKTAKNAAPVQASLPAKSLKTAEPVKGIAKKLPSKNAETGATLPVQTVSEGTKVVAVHPESALSSSDAVESEAAAADEVEIIDMPTE
jgi:ribosomal protein L44E